MALPSDRALALGPRSHGPQPLVNAYDIFTAVAAASALFLAPACTKSEPGCDLTDFDGDGYWMDRSDPPCCSCGWAGPNMDQADCDDENSSIHPNSDEVPGNAFDEDCNGVLE